MRSVSRCANDPISTTPASRQHQPDARRISARIDLSKSRARLDQPLKSARAHPDDALSSR
jgi:hypothetical protein